MNRDLGDERREYGREKLDRASLPENPLVLFSLWLAEALDAEIPDPTAMTLSTVNGSGRPSSRIVLIKSTTEAGLVFFTSYHSQKSQEIKANKQVAAHFYWPELERQVRINGCAEILEKAESDRYFYSRPYESKIAAWASPQSDIIPGRAYLDKAFEKYEKKFPESGPVPRPDTWGGFVIQPSTFEFWQGGVRRLHDRFLYTKDKNTWISRRLAP